MYASGWATSVYGPQENQRVTSGIGRELQQRGGVGRLGRAQGQCRAYEGEHGASRFAAAMLGLLYDVHGNLPALEAVLDDAQGLRIDGWVLGGDYALFGGWPAETLALLRTLPDATWIRGNGERWSAPPGDAPDDPVVQGAIASAVAILGPRDVADLAALPESTAIGEATRAWHGSPRERRAVLPARAPGRRRRAARRA